MTSVFAGDTKISEISLRLGIRVDLTRRSREERDAHVYYNLLSLGRSLCARQMVPAGWRIKAENLPRVRSAVPPTESRGKHVRRHAVRHECNLGMREFDKISYNALFLDVSETDFLLKCRPRAYTNTVLNYKFLEDLTSIILVLIN